jgi:hypothetical protein
MRRIPTKGTVMKARLILLALLALILGSATMARDTNYQPDRKPGRDFTQEDAYWQSERGRDLQSVF